MLVCKSYIWVMLFKNYCVAADIGADRMPGTLLPPISRAYYVIDDLRHRYSSPMHRPLAPGDYTLQAEAEGFEAQEVAITVPTDGSGVRHNFTFTAAPTGRAPPSQVSSRLGREGSGRQQDSQGVSDTHASLNEPMPREGQAVRSGSGAAVRGSSGVGGRPVVGAAASAAESSDWLGLRSRKVRSDVHQRRGRTLAWQAAAAAGAAAVVWALHRRRRRRRMWAIRD